jgi:hypothetical protein
LTFRIHILNQKSDLSLKEDACRLVRQFEGALQLDAFALQVMGEKMRGKYF